MKRQLSSVLLPVLILSVLVVGVPIADAHTVRKDSHVTIGYHDARDRFQGRVFSQRERCEQFRTVQVFREKPNDDLLVGQTLSNRNGFWKVGDEGSRGEYYAKVLRRQFVRNNHTHVCRGDRSPTIRVHPAGG